MIKVLHIFNEYLPKTEHWAYQMISNTPGCEQHIAAKVYLENKPGQGQFYFMENPLSNLEEEDQKTDWKKSIVKKAIIRTKKLLSKGLQMRLEEYVAENKIQLLHAHFANIGWEMEELKRETGLPLVVSFYGWDYEMLPHVKPQWVARYKELFDHADIILTEGGHGKSSLIEKGCKEEKLMVQKLGIENDLINYKTRSKNKSELNLIQIASFTEKKGQLFTVQAFAKAIESCPNMTLTLIGDKRDEAYHKQVEALISEKKLANKITLKEFIPYDKIGDELSKHHVFIHPSCYAANMNCEGGAPTIIFNAAGSGMPCIGTTHCDIPSLVIHGETGILSPEKELDGIAESIRAFYEMDTHDYKIYSEAAHQHILENYNISENAAQLAKIYSKILDSAS